MRRSIPLILSGAVACAAPATDDDPVPRGGADQAGDSRIVIRPEQSAYATGATAELIVENHAERELGYNLCAAMELDRRENDTWTPVPRDPDRVCTMELRILPPGESRTGAVTLPDDLPAGAYRFRFVGLTWTDGEPPPPGPVTTEAFEVEAG